MADIKLTESQSLAVGTRGCSILVSAAAGSGKTKVLVERLMSYITDADDPKDIDSFLIITYTRAAAAQLRERIIEGINELAARNPFDRRLRRQSALCYQARIGTIHSFCTSVLRENSHLAGITPDFRVLEDERARQIRRSVLDRLLERMYEHIDTDPGFRSLVDTVGAGRDDSRLSELVINMHEKMLSNAWPERWVHEQEDALEARGVSDIAGTPWGGELLRSARETVGYWYRQMYDCAGRLSESDAKVQKAYLSSFCDSRDALERLKNALEQGWDSARRALPVEFPRLGALRSDPDPELTTYVKSVREKCKKAMEKLASDFAEPSEQLLSELRGTAGAMRSLLRLTLRFDELFSQEKRRQGCVDFSDLEHLTLRLLCDADSGEPTKLARELSGGFTEILVDEYQDVNEVQELIFRCVSRAGDNLFMVGDVKQSIYRFRLADPTIFLEKYRAYAPAERAEEGQPRRILLRENFRSRACILESANHIFANIMSQRLGELDYDENAALRYGATYYDEQLDVPVSFEILPAPDGDVEDAPDKLTLEARHTAARIRTLIDSGAPVTENGSVRPATYGDIVILLRSPGPAGVEYRRALTQAGIPVASEQGGGFFTSLEVSVTISILAVIDDPHQDVALINALRSPAFGFNSDELSRVRAADRQGDFFTALSARAGQDGKCAAFLETLSSLRAIAPDLSVCELLLHVYSVLDLPALFSAMSDGAARRGNLFLLLEYARKFEENGWRGLFRFVSWLRGLSEKGEEPPVSGAGGDAVRIMSIHKSKGLEFPYVFIPDTARRFNRSDTMGPVLIHSQLGLGPKYTDLELNVEYPTVAHRAVSARIKRETLSEEMRILYVGATRAQERLFFSCVWKAPEEKLEKLRREAASPVEPEVLLGCQSFSEWLARTAVLDGSPIEMKVTEPETAPPVGELAPREDAQPSAGLISELSRKLAFNYQWTAATQLPSKLTATELKGSRESDPDAQELVPAQRPAVFRMPDFAAGEKALTGTERGVASHLVLQHMDLSCAGSVRKISDEIQRLKIQGFISEKQAEAVEAQALYEFFSSETGQRILSADRVRREFRFSLLCPAGELFEGAQGESLLLQGVVDCCIEEHGELTIIDYKTDYVTSDTIDERAEYYSGQLRVYTAAMERILKMPVREAILYFLRAGRAVKVDLGDTGRELRG